MERSNGFGKYLRTTLTVGDFLVLNFSYFITILFVGPESPFASKWIWLLANISYIPSVLFFSAIHDQRILFADRVVLTAFKSVFTQAVCLLCMLYLLDIFTIADIDTLIFFGIFWFLLSVWWILGRWMLKRLRRMGINFKRAIIIGTGTTSEILLQELRSDAGYGYRVLGIFDDLEPDAARRPEFHGFPVMPLDEMEAFVRDRQIDLIYYTLSGEERQQITDAMQIAEEFGAEFDYVPKFNKVLSGQFTLRSTGSLPTMVYTLSPLNKAHNRLLKRGLDLAVSVPFLLVSPIIFLPIAVAIKLSSPGPVFFRQKRTGFKGKDFTCYKFRTMKVNKDCDKVQATENDPRKTKLGDFLRRSSLDELPQFINVFLGNMSVVGPRPHMLSHTVEYSALIDKYMVRHAVKPGITGWAQVNGYRGGTKHLWQMEKRVEYDVWYIRNWNILLDMKIIFLTAFNALRHDDNAY